MEKSSRMTFCIVFIASIFMFISPFQMKAHSVTDEGVLILTNETEMVDLYEVMYILSDNETKLSVYDIASGAQDGSFYPAEQFPTKFGFFDIAKWIKFKIENSTDLNEWYVEFAFPLIYQIHLYEESSDGITKLVTGGAHFPFAERELYHRFFVYSLDIPPGETRTFYARVHGGADLHPPIRFWHKDSFVEASHTESGYLGIFYGMIVVMIVYNLFLYISLRIRTYLFYVLSIFFTLLAQLALNGLGFKYLWPTFPAWNTMAVPFLASTAFIFIILFTRDFLDTEKHARIFHKLSYTFISLHVLTIILLFIEHYAALNVMLCSAFITSSSVIVTSIICLFRGVREARFFIVGWFIFLGGVGITILERAALIPYSLFTEYAGQWALSIEVVILSFALADKINIIRKEKERVAQAARRSQELVVESLQKADDLKDEFLAITSHELRTPLYGMIGIAESLKEGIAGKPSEEMEKQFDLIISSGRRLSHLVNDILDYAKLQKDTLQLNKKRVDLSGLVDIVFMVCQPLLKGKDIKLVNETERQNLFVLADSARLQQIMYNLIGNAIKFTDQGTVTVQANIADDHVHITVADTGVGIAADMIDTILQPFTQADPSVSRAVGGTGIGLSITKELIELHDSTLSIESEVGAGSQFSFALPLIQTGEIKKKKEVQVFQAEKQIEPMISHVKESGMNVLVADDEPVNLQVLLNQLTLEGIDTTLVTSGTEALAAIAKERFDVVILDIMMPEMSGYEVCQILREQYSLLELPIIMLTAKNQMQDKLTAFKVGANDYLSKPCDKEELFARIRTLANLKSLNEELTRLNLELEEEVRERTVELEFANEDLIRTNKTLIEMAESRRNLLANVAHELGTPVTLIHTYLQSIQDGVIDRDDLYYRELVDDKINVLNRLIDDLSDLSRLESGKASLSLRENDLFYWLDSVQDKLMYDVAAYGRKFHSDSLPFHEKMFECSIDVERMDQVFTNIISNAIKHTSDVDGEIYVTVDIDTNNSNVIVSISDNGSGIEKEMLPHIFNRFYQADYSEDDETGTGLGLAIVKEIVHGHGGEVWVESKVGEGSTFYFSLPVRKMYGQLSG